MGVLITALVLMIIVTGVETYGLIAGCYSFSGKSLRKRVLHSFHPGAAAIQRILDKIAVSLRLDVGENSKACYRKLYVGQNYEEIRAGKQLDMIAGVLLIITVTCVMVLGLKLGGLYEVSQVESVNRPEMGAEQLKLKAVYDEESYIIEFELDERYPTAEEMQKRILSTESILEQAILGDNQSLGEVRSNLNLKESYNDTGVKVRWVSSDTSLLHSDGTVDNKDIYVSEKVSLKAVITCYELSFEREFEVTIVPAGESSANRALLVKTLEDSLQAAKGVGTVELPTDANGKEVSFYTIVEDDTGKILMLGLLCALLIIPLWYENRRKDLRLREAQLMNDYPELVSKLSLLLEAGLNTRSAIERLATDYEKRRTVGKNRYVYEELLIARNELCVGKGETEAYEAFGRRCGNVYYIRLSALLSQNVKKGGESLLPQLRKEVSEALREKQLAIRKKGEEAGMKLLLPMMGMFALVIAIILVPAFMSM